jgi:L-asparaginase
MGALVAFADQVHAARWVRKTHTTSVTAFASPDAGPVGMLVEGTAVRLVSLDRLPTYAPTRRFDSRVPVLAIGMDDGGELLAGVEDHCDGLVVAGLGAGHVPPSLAEPLGALAKQMPVVLASRAAAGPVLSRTYGSAGSETDLLGRGLLHAGLLDAFKARTLVRVALASGLDRPGVAAAFAVVGGWTRTPR